MSNSKHYADKCQLREQTQLFADAARRLSLLGIEISTVDFQHDRPLIRVFDCPGLVRFKSQLRGRGCNEQGHYVRKQAQVQGCDVVWNEGVDL